MSRTRRTLQQTSADSIRSQRDRGLTLPEILVAVVVSGLLVAVMAAATRVVVRQGDNTTGRLNNARSEQAVGVWMPTDLASAELVDDSASATPCGAVCPPNVDVSGSNTLMLTWTGTVAGATSTLPTITKVSYRYIEISPTDYEIHRVECMSVDGAAPTCSQVTVLHNVMAPPPGIEYIPGVTKPSWVMLVTLAVDPVKPGDGTDLGLSGNGSTLDPTYYYREGRRVTVTINGGGDLAGTGGGQDQITLTAGGTRRDPNLSTTNLSAAPTFAATRSRCGGNFGLLVDTSGSIGSNMSYVRSGAAAFIDAFAGTPIKLQVVPFSSVATTLGAGTGWGKYYDMLVDSDVAALKALVNGLNSSGYTNWEDAFFRMFRNADGTVQQVLPDTLIFFTDGMPTYNRLNDSTAKTTSPAVADTADSGLPLAGSSGSYNQLSWNRANRIARVYEADLEKFIGVFVGTDIGGSSTWTEQGAGYHLTNFLHGYHETWEQGYHVTNPQRGSHTLYEYASSGVTYQYAQSGLTYQYSTTGLSYEYAGTGLIYEQKLSGNWTGVTKAVYEAGNANNTTTDNYRVRIDTSKTLGNWTTLNASEASAKVLYDKSNTAVGDADGFRVSATGSLGPTWTNTTKAVFDLTNLTPDSTDGYRIVVGSPSSWTSTTKAFYDTNNAVAGASDGFQVIVSGTLKTWVTTTQAYYTANNLPGNTDSLDGFRATVTYSAPYTDWAATTDAAYLAGNTTTDNTDGWDAVVSYSAPFTYWGSVSQGTYNSNNSTADSADGWRVSKVYSTPYSAWENSTELAYTGGNTVWGNADGWDATKDYTEPYTFHEGYSTGTRKNTDILKQIVAPGGVVPAQKSGATYTNSQEATYYELPTWDQFAGAMTSMALAECGGTVTLQTKIGAATAADPFTYQSSVDKTTATTSAQFRSGTFDFDLAGGGSISVTLSPVINSDQNLYSPVGWSCKAGGVAYPFTATPIVGGPWTSITLTVSPNQAISCINSVTLK